MAVNRKPDTGGSTSPQDGLYVVLLSLHGLLRGHDMELGRDPDTGGQTKYVVELARALARSPEVGRVDLLTRMVSDSKVSADYAQPEEPLGHGAHIIRIPFGPRRYLRKEALWNHLDAFVDNAILHFSRINRVPDFVHSHYADAGYAGSRLAQLLGVPLVHTGHSLGRVKRERLQARGIRNGALESEYRITQRIEAEEIALGNAAMVVASTSQEIDEQYSQYENYHPSRMVVIPPGVDLARFRPPSDEDDSKSQIGAPVRRFLAAPDKPMILALSRADERKNIAALVRAYGESAALREAANLVIVAGNRDDISAMDKGPREVLTELLLLMDRYNLYGSLAIPKQHEPDDVPDLYRLAARTRGVFVNPALTEPFGLTLIEAAASGLPVAATEDGGPIDILRHCENGLLFNPLDEDAIAATLLKLIRDKRGWERRSRNGLSGVAEHYSWPGHVRSYLRALRSRVGPLRGRRSLKQGRSRLPEVRRLLVCDIDNTLLGDRGALRQLINRLREQGGRVGFGVATGRRLESTVEVLREWGVPLPDIMITAVGSEINYGHTMHRDEGWARQINYLWRPKDLRRAMRDIPGLKLQPASEQREFKLSWYVQPERMPPLREIRRHLRRLDLHAKIIYSHQAYLDLLPVRASKGLAVRYLAMRWGIAPEELLVAGDSGNDEEMLSGSTLGVVVGNYSEELERLRGRARIYFAGGHYANGILEAIDYYNFFGRVRILNDDPAR